MVSSQSRLSRALAHVLATFVANPGVATLRSQSATAGKSAQISPSGDVLIRSGHGSNHRRPSKSASWTD